MNCDQADELILDLLYGELDAAAQASLQAHLGQCPRCRQELAKLQSTRAVLKRYRADEPQGEVKTPLKLAAPTRPTRKTLWSRLWISAASAAAAVLLLAAGLMLFRGTSSSPVMAASGPVEIKRVNVSLTILSQPEHWNGPIAPISQGAYPVAPPEYTWTGMALVRDQRLVRHLGKGVAEVRFTDVPTQILPETVRLRGLDNPEGLTILEQNYQYDLASADAVLKKYIDKNIGVDFKDGTRADGKLLSYGLGGAPAGQSLVIQPAAPAGPSSLSPDRISSIRLEKLPDGLLTRPTLVWQLRNNAAQEQQFEVAYLTKGLQWRADYVLKLHPSEKADGANAVDGADLVGYATVSNQSGVTYEDAQLKLMAGDVNLIQPAIERAFKVGAAGGGGRDAKAHEGFEEKSFFEYHLYTLGRATTIRDRETKQIELISGSGLKMKRAYVYDPQQNATAARVVSELVNSKANNLGVPLPKGIVRLYAPDPEGEETYVSQTTIDHTPVDEKLRLPWGFAFDIACTQKSTDFREKGADCHVAFEYSLRNHKDHDVTITAIIRVPHTTYRFEAAGGRRWHIREVGVIEIEVPVKANTEEKIEFNYNYNGLTGGGLKEPG